MAVTQPRKYQKQGILQIEKSGIRTLLADDMGLGKTLQALWIIRRNKVKCTPSIVLCPASLKWQWANEAAKHVELRAEVLEGKRPPKGGFMTPHNLLILNYEILGAWLPWLIRLKPKFLVIDEAQRIKNPSAKCTQYAKILAKPIPHILPMSGTPIENRPDEIFTVVHMLWPEEFPSRTEFLNRYLKMRMTRYGWQPKGVKNIPELHARLKACGMIRRRKVDVLTELPPKTRTVLPVSLTADKMREYEFARKDLVNWIAQNYGTGRARKAKRNEAMLRVGYLKRLAAKLKYKSVIEWIQNFMEETDEKLLVSAIHKPAIRTLRKYFPQSVVIDGSVTGQKRQRAVDQFQHDKNTRILIGQLRAAGVGLNLTAASKGIVTELGWTPGEHEQFEDRLHRIGQDFPVHWWYLVAKGTIEERMCQMIQEKMGVVRGVLDGEEVSVDFNLFDNLVSMLERGAA